MDITAYFDELCGIPPTSLHYTKHSASKNEELVLKELTNKSCVFDYIPGRCYPSFKNIEAHVSGCIDIFKLVAKIKGAIADYMDLKMILKSMSKKEIILSPSYDSHITKKFWLKLSIVYNFYNN